VRKHRTPRRAPHPHGARVLTTATQAGSRSLTGLGLSPIYRAARRKKVFVFADETLPAAKARSSPPGNCARRHPPRRHRRQTPPATSCTRQIDLAIVGSDALRAMATVANKIGTYEKAVPRTLHGIPFYVPPPPPPLTSTAHRRRHPIEERSEDEVLYAIGRDDEAAHARPHRTEGDHARNPAFERYARRARRGIITQKGVFSPAILAANERLLRADALSHNCVPRPIGPPGPISSHCSISPIGPSHAAIIFPIAPPPHRPTIEFPVAYREPQGWPSASPPHLTKGAANGRYSE